MNHNDDFFSEHFANFKRIGFGNLFSIAIIIVLGLGALMTVKEIQEQNFNLQINAQTGSTASLSFSPVSQTVSVNNTFAVQVRVNSGISVNAVQANISYPADKLELLSIDTSSSAFSIQAQQTLGTGSVMLARGTTTPVSGDRLIAVLNFKGKAAGAAVTSFDTTSAVVSSTANTNILTTKNTGTYTIQSATVPATPTQPLPTTPPPSPTTPVTSSGTAALSIIPLSQSTDTNVTFPVEVHVNSGASPINAVQANISYPADKLELVSIDTSASAFPIQAEQTLGTGTIRLARGTTTPVTGDRLVAKILLKGKLVGTSPISFTDGSAVITSTTNTNILTTKTGASVTVNSIVGIPSVGNPWKGEYFNNTMFSGGPVLTRDDEKIDFDWGTGSPASSIPNNKFSVRWNKKENFDGGAYKFTASNDDGMIVFLDRDVIYKSWYNQSAHVRTFTRTVSAGVHELNVVYYENRGKAVAKFSWIKQ